MFTRTLSAIAAAALTAGTVAIATPAHAAPAEDSVTISVAGLDLSNPSDAARFDRRVRGAARELCGTKELAPIEMTRDVAGCQAQVVANAKADVEIARAKGSAPFRLALRVR